MIKQQKQINFFVGIRIHVPFIFFLDYFCGFYLFLSTLRGRTYIAVGRGFRAVLSNVVTRALYAAGGKLIVTSEELLCFVENFTLA